MGIRRQNEEGFLQTVLQLARLHNWKTYHTRNSRRSDKGWPDLVLCKPPVILFVELKKSDEDETTKEQEDWLAVLRACGLDARTWRPRDWDEIHAVLSGEAG